MNLPSVLLLLPMLGSFAAAALAPKVELDAGQVAFFEQRIRPVLVAKCYQCHSAEAEKLKGGLLLDTRAGVLAGGDSGAAIAPGDPRNSPLLHALRWADKDTRMPPKEPLPPEVVADFERWIAMGAPDPREGPAPAARPAIDVEKGRGFWAFRPPVTGAAPAVRDAAWPRTLADRFILGALESAGLRPVADAEPRDLVRRVFFDLTGLPPTPEESDAFVLAARTDRTGALTALVDRLLASPRFGERWGRYWLDVARYAESSGKERNFAFPTAWRYRDWVIAAVNADKPYDQFIREQIAGDLLPAASAGERDALTIATGFLALGPKSLNEKNRAQFQADLIDEQIDATTRAVLGLTIACARCHDHKYDPVRQEDYYALAGIFKSTATHFGAGADKNGRTKNGLPLLSLGSAVGDATPPPASPAKNVKNAKKARKLLAGKKAAPVAADGERCMGVREDAPANARLLVRGELDQPGALVPRGFPAVLASASQAAIPPEASGRRELAAWLTARENPLVARVAVNRVWAHLFGQGLVRTPDNFGATGERPSHPELLDALAMQFMEDGWSVKRLVRSLVLSRVYQLSTSRDSAALEIDPDNRLRWRQASRRLDAEAIRDAMLAAGGQLELRPPAGSFVATVGSVDVGRTVKPEAFSDYESRHRSVYLPIVRNCVPEVLELFDFAEPSLVVAARDSTNVPSQALYLMNNGFVRAQAAALARRVLAQPLDHAQRIQLAHRLALGRPATASEVERAQRYLLEEARGLIPVKGGDRQQAAELSWTTFCQALFACAEFRYLH